MSGKELAALVNVLAINIADCKSDEELAVLSAVFMQIGDTLTLISAQNALLENCKNNTDTNVSNNNGSKAGNDTDSGNNNKNNGNSGVGKQSLATSADFSGLTGQQTAEIVNNVAKSVAGIKK